MYSLLLKRVCQQVSNKVESNLQEKVLNNYKEE